MQNGIIQSLFVMLYTTLTGYRGSKLKFEFEPFNDVPNYIAAMFVRYPSQTRQNRHQFVEPADGRHGWSTGYPKQEPQFEVHAITGASSNSLPRAHHFTYS